MRLLTQLCFLARLSSASRPNKSKPTKDVVDLEVTRRLDFPRKVIFVRDDMRGGYHVVNRSDQKILYRGSHEQQVVLPDQQVFLRQPGIFLDERSSRQLPLPMPPLFPLPLKAISPVNPGRGAVLMVENPPQRNSLLAIPLPRIGNTAYVNLIRSLSVTVGKYSPECFTSPPPVPCYMSDLAAPGESIHLSRQLIPAGWLPEGAPEVTLTPTSQGTAVELAPSSAGFSLMVQPARNRGRGCPVKLTGGVVANYSLVSVWRGRFPVFFFFSALRGSRPLRPEVKQGMVRVLRMCADLEWDENEES